MQDEFGFTTTQISDMLGIWSLTYGTGQLVNGLITDRIGGKRSMQIGAFGTIVVNCADGVAAFARGGRGAGGRGEVRVPRGIN
jgi:sugar phosphate permease